MLLAEKQYISLSLSRCLRGKQLVQFEWNEKPPYCILPQHMLSLNTPICSFFVVAVWIIYNVHFISNSVDIKSHPHSKCERESILGDKNGSLSVIWKYFSYNADDVKQAQILSKICIRIISKYCKGVPGLFLPGLCSIQEPIHTQQKKKYITLTNT